MSRDDPPADWPHRAQGRRLAAGGHEWWLIDTAPDDRNRPALLCLHGAGGSGHSFRALITEFPDHRLIVPDLPGQGFSRPAPGAAFGLDPLAEAVAALLGTLRVTPGATIGHSAGGAIALRLAELGATPRVVGINAALGAFDGMAAVLFPMMARVLASLPLVPQAVSRLWGNPASVERLLASTGSRIDAAGRAQYRKLVARSAHVEGTLGMMAAWDLAPLLARLPSLATPTLFLVAEDDGTVPSRLSRRAAEAMPAAVLQALPRGGHLLQETLPAETAARIRAWLQPSA